MQNDNTSDPDWDTPIEFSTTPAQLIHTLFATASNVHTGWTSCVDDALCLNNLVALDDATGNYCRLVEQEYVEDENEEVVWHDWTVELRMGDLLITGHWQIQATSPPMDWEWCAQEAEKVFEKACVLFGKRVRRGIGVETANPEQQAPQQRRH